MTDDIDTEQTDGEGSCIAIVGMSGRFPGAPDVAHLWSTIRDGRSGVTRFTDEQLRAAGVSEELLSDPSYVKANPVLDGIEDFDAEFFGVSPKEAQILDPQQRLFLEHSWAALEEAGCDPARFEGAIGVFAGSAWSSYMQNNLMPSGIVSSMGELAVGLANDKDSLTTRVAHALGLTGPSYSVQSYCSTSLVAVCAAATSLANFECDVALAGGVAISVPNKVGYLYQPGGITPPDAECRAFDEAGLGAPMGSGVGVVALRRLEDALADGDRIHAVIRGWAVNNDGGRKVGFTAPGVHGQAGVIAEALASADLTPADIDYVEAHGTGTALGDAVEIAALHQVFQHQSVKIGSVKTNVGHLDRAAGVTNLIKAVLSLGNEEIPPTRNFGTPNRQLAAGDAQLEVVTELTPWPRSEDHVRRAGVSSFGIGGTNAHVVVEEPPRASRPEPSPRPELLIWSARSEQAADAQTDRLAEHLATGADRLADVAYTLQTGRKVFGHRRMLATSTVYGSTVDGEVVTALRAGEVLSRVESRTDRPVAMLIAGTGEQYPGMAADLYATEPVFRAVLDECRAVLVDRLDGLDPLAEMLGERGQGGGLAALLGRDPSGERATPKAEQTDRLQPAMFAVQYALAKLLESWGVVPSVLAGYSVGEYVAACLSGVLSLPDALALVAYRAQLINELPAGEMAAVPLSEQDTRARLVPGLDIAAVNGPALTVVAGEPGAMARFADALDIDVIPCRRLATTHAFHSAMLAPVKQRLTDWVRANVTLNAPRIPYLSNVSGTLATAEQVSDPAYWAEHMCAPVRFHDVLGELLRDQDVAVLELGPGQSLGVMARGHEGCGRDRWPLIVPTLPAENDRRPASVLLAEAAGRLWLAGVPVDWTGYQQGRPVAKVSLPTYPFERQRYWIDAPAQRAGVTPAAVPAEPVRPAAHVDLMRPEWTQRPLGEQLAEVARCVLVGGDEAVAGALADALTAAGVEVRRTVATEVVNDGATVLDLRLLVPDPSTVDAETAVRDAAALLNAWGGAAGNSRIVLVTRGGHAVTGDETPEPAAAAVAVLPVVAGQEYLNLDCRVIDLDETTDAVAVLAAEVRQVSEDVLAAYRSGRRLVREFVVADAEPAGTAPAVVEGGTYLITGGLGDVGLLLAEHLAQAGAGRLVLTSRGGVPDGAGDRRSDGVARLREYGVEVLTPAVDVTDLDAMRALLAEVAAGGRIDGVVHAAAVTGQNSFAVLRDVDAAGVRQHFGAKVDGARVLETVLGELAEPPRFCVLFSSTSSILGGLAFGSYAAANAALTAIAERNHDRGWVAACWDTWSITLEQVQGAVGAAMVQHSMSTEEGMAAFDRMVATPRPVWVVAAGGLTDRLPTAATAMDLPSGGQRFPRPELPNPYTAPLTATERALAELWTDVLGIEPIGTRDAFFDLGGNSLLGLQMLTLVKKRFGVSVPSVTLFEAPTVHALAASLDEQGATAPASPARITAIPRQAPDEDRRIAIVGMAGRFPGASDVDTFWQNICAGVESISRFTPEELRATGVPEEQLADPAYVPARPILDDVRSFDAAFFGMNPRMAAMTDPQQRIFLEVCWEALEHAGYAAPEGRGRVGVYGGSNISTYLLANPDVLTSGDFSVYEVIMGNDKDALTTQVSYLMDLYGPSVAVQTFCSTSLVATHMAVQALRNGECELAMAGGVSVQVPDKAGHVYEPGGMASPDGHVRTFDAQARGSMFGDGASVVVLKRLSDAVRDGDYIHAVIRGSAMNNDGALKVGYTAPSVVGQSRVVADALADAGVTGSEVSYVECHGTATELGDPIEIVALTKAFGDTEDKQFCRVGSVKTNVGHLDRAAGTTGLIKTALSLRNDAIPPTLHYTAPNPKIDFANSPFFVNTELSPFPEGKPPIAGVSSLGMGGTNVHVVLEKAPERAPVVESDPDAARRFHVLPVSARTERAVEQHCRRLGAHLETVTDATRLRDVAFSLQAGRQRFDHRRALLTDDLATAATELGSLENVLARHDSAKGRPVAFVFAGVGEQYPGMVRELYRREPAFAAALDDCLGLLGDAADFADLLTGVRGGQVDLAALLGRSSAPADERTAALERTEVVQPALFAVEYAVARTLLAWGLRPQVMLGYSLGEYVAACLAGVLSLEDAIKLVAHRARLIDALPGGGMLAVSATVEALAGFDLADRGIDVAAINGPQVTVVAGPHEALAELTDLLHDNDIVARPLSTTHAFHSRMLEPVAAELTAWVRDNISLNAPKIPYISNVTGTRITAEQAGNPAYWARHMCQTVRFGDAVATLLAEPELAIVEIGPGQSLGALVRGADCPPERWPLIQATLPAVGDQRPDDQVLTDALARLWLTGVDVDWNAYHDGTRPYRVPLPTYPFQRQQYWLKSTGGGESTGRVEISVTGLVEEPSGPHVEVLTPRWTPEPIDGEPAEVPLCLVIPDAGGIGDQLVELLRSQDVDARLVGSTDFPAAAAEHAIEGQTTVVDLRLLDHPDSDVDGRETVRPVAAVMDAWASRSDSARVLVVTRGGHAVRASEVPVVAQTAPGIMAAVANLEYLNLDCATVDLDDRATVAESAAALAAEVRRPAATGDVLVAHRDGVRHARTFQPEAHGLAPIAVREGGTYLITGGLGDIGLLLAGHLAEAGAARLVLTSRAGLPDDATGKRADIVAGLRARGVEVDVPAVDVTDEDAMRALIDGVIAERGRLDGVVHLAAITDPGTFRAVRDVDDEAVRLHFGAKVAGARVLETVLGGLPAEQAPEFCLLFSSTSSVLGGITFSCYATSNAALTAIGQRNHDRFVAGELATCWIASSWDTWAVTLDKIKVGAVQEKHSMSPQEALAAFDTILADPGPWLVVAAGGLDGRLPKASSIADVVLTGERFPRPSLPNSYAPAATDTEKALADLWSHLLGVEPVGVKDAFFDLGGNSLLGLQMLSLVKKRFGVSVPAVTLFEAPNVQALAKILDGEGATDKEAVPAPRAERPAVTTEVTDDDRIAIVGMAGRFPGASDVDTFWQNICAGVESISRFTPEELRAAGVPEEQLSDPAYVPARPVLDDVQSFDAAFFGISPRMASVTDPQQRIFLEVCWEALEQAGYVAPEGRGRVGVFGGSNISTYLFRNPDTMVSGEFSSYEVIMGNDKDALTTQVSYLLDLSGPSVAVQTFCSTSLVATHMAVRSLRHGECEMALAGGVSVHVPDRAGHVFEPGGMASPDGHVRTFDAQARGSMFGDGAAVVALKRLSDAVRDGDYIHAVIRGSAMNNDGALKVGYTAPSVVGQSRVVVDALADAGVSGSDVSYVECHGTATELGDPIEVAALTRAFGDTEDKQFCRVGSVKTNVGHLDRAAGATGLIKTALAVRENMIPPTLHYTEPNPQIDFENSPFYVNTELSPFPEGKAPIAGVSSLGMGGTNAHVVVEKAPERPAVVESDPDAARRFHVLPVSARTEAAATQACERLGSHLAGTVDAFPLADVAYTLQVGRKLFEHRRVLVADATAAAATAFADGQVLGRADATTERPVAFVFSGVGEQYPGMVRELYRREPAFAAVLDECLGLLSESADFADLLTGARGGGPDLAALLGRATTVDERGKTLERTEVVQPALFAVEFALARTLMAWGVRPRVMLGYSLGEYVAACLAGVLSLPDALKLVAHRAKLIDALPGGAMVAVGLTPGQLVSYGLVDRGIDIAAVNGPQATVLAGPAEALDVLVELLRSREIPARPLQTTHAFHSRMLAPVADELTTWVRQNVSLNPPRIPYISNTTGAQITAGEATDPAYWARHMCQTVQFGAAVEALLAEPGMAIVEVGPGQSLGALIRGAGCPREQWPLIQATLPAANDQRPDDQALTDALARLWLTGVAVDWKAYHEGNRRCRVPLPTYRFQRQRYWREGPALSLAALTGTAPVAEENPLDVVARLPKLPEQQWLHLPVWRQTAAPAAAEQQPGSWLVYAADGFATDIVAGLRSRTDATVTEVRAGDAFAVTATGYTIRPGNVDDTLALLRELRASGTALERVLHLWTVDATGDDAVHGGLHTLVALARAAGELGLDGWSLDVVTTGAEQVLPGDPVNPHAATATGPALVIPMEFPSVRSRLVDVDRGAKAVGALVAELARPATERIVALRHGRRWVPGYESTDAPADPGTDVLRDGGVYLITGGLGGIGLAMAQRLATDHHAKLVLFGRTGIDGVGARAQERAAAIQRLRDAGAEIEVVTGDVADPADVRQAVSVAQQRFGALHGVLHAAGLPGMGLIQLKNPDELDPVLAPKVAGTLAITEALGVGTAEEVELDFLVLFSSITAATGGGPGQVDYCAANAFMDAYAHELAEDGRRVVSVDWGEWQWNAWEEGLSGYADSLQEFLRDNRKRIGLEFDEGWRSLLRALAAGEPRVVVSTQDFETVVGFSAHFTLEAVATQAMAAAGGERHPRPELMTPYQEPSGRAEERIAELWCQSLHLEQVGVLDNFFELGGNSLLGVNIVATVRAEFGLDELPPHVLYEAPTVAALAKVVEAGNDRTDSTAKPADEGRSLVRAQLRRSGLEAAARRRGR
ncbi:type I polyketide synthase [Labedaea rhizosphaerae]|uniref:Acyl transferase domain-containing protein n=1 Tax=Labedaea rhizosphaerae TaxID=598644 RepID=A0A4R6SFZ9_LABRH|nr:type I polyketide synthase [Labedaea rhizosphaerae]TDQ00457.1 acyl transferase domain-containing protein [Labedaea rhizosphaerae]